MISDACQRLPPWLLLVAKMIPSPTSHPYTTSVLAGVIPAAVLLYVAFLRRSSRGPTPDFNRLITKEAGTGKAAKKWSAADGTDTDGEVTWLGDTELRVLEALCDTLLPGFEVDTAKGANAVVEQVRRARIFLLLLYDTSKAKCASIMPCVWEGGAVYSIASSTAHCRAHMIR